MSDQNKEKNLEKIKFNDFEVIEQLGRGSYSEVLLVKHRISQQEYALKILNKKQILKERKKHEVFVEKLIL